MKAIAIKVPHKGIEKIYQTCNTQNEIRTIFFLLSMINRNGEVRIRSVELASVLECSDTTAKRLLKGFEDKMFIIKTKKKDTYVFGDELALTHQALLETEED